MNTMPPALTPSVVNSRPVRGFTLIELLIVMVIIGIVATILLGFFGNSYRKTQLRDGAFQVLTDLRQARAQALRTSQNSSVTLTSTAVATPDARYTLVWSSGGASPTSITTNRTLASPIRVAPYTTSPVSSARTITYTGPYGEVTGTGVVWEISSTVISDKLYVKAVGVTGKVILSATPN